MIKKFLTTSLIFIMLAVTPLVPVEMLLRQKEESRWFLGLANHCRSQHVDYLFLGTSMAAASVDAGEFAKEVRGNAGALPQAFNLGQGYSTPVEYLFGLKKMVAANRKALTNVCVFIEAPGGIPSYDLWSDDWMNAKMPVLLSEYIDMEQLGMYWRTVNTALANKMLLTAAHFSLVAAYFRTFQQSCIVAANDLSGRLLNERSRTDSDLTDTGGIRTDAEGMRLARQLTITQCQHELEHQRPIDWNATVMKDLVAYIQANGGSVYFFDEPVSSVMAAPLRTPIRNADRQSFVTQVGAWHCRLLKPEPVSASDDDFPDLLHMNKSLAGTFTRALARSYEQSLGQKP